MARIALIAGTSNSWANDLWKTLRQISTIHEYYVAEICNLGSRAQGGESEASYLYIPSLTDRDGMMPDLSEAELAFQQSARLRPRKLVLLSSALIYGTGRGDRVWSRKIMLLEVMAGIKFAADGNRSRRWPGNI